jgi:hypothetical protein
MEKVSLPNMENVLTGKIRGVDMNVKCKDEYME